VEDKSRRNINDLPSWVPDYTYSLMTKPFNWFGIRDTNTGRVVGDTSTYLPGGLYNASLAAESSLRSHTITNNTLIVSGALFDRVIEISKFEVNPNLEDLILQPLHICCGLEEIYCPTGQPRVEVLWRTIIADSYGTDLAPVSPAPLELASCFRDLVLWEIAKLKALGKDTFKLKLECLEKLRGSTQSLAVLPSREAVIAMATVQRAFFVQENLSEDEQQEAFFMRELVSLPMDVREEVVVTCENHTEGKSNAYKDTLMMTMKDRRVYRTSRGFLGVGPISTQEGDQVWLVRSAHVPFILRQTANDDTFSLIGETYLHGFMHGEMLTNDLKVRIKPVRIV